MRSFEERWSEIRNDPIKLKRVFTIVWIIAYSMLILGGFIIIWVFLQSV